MTKVAAQKFMEKYGANVAGFFWNAGTALQFVFGIIAQSPREIASSIFNVASPCSFLLFGHRNTGVALGGILGIIGTFLAVEPQIRAGEPGSCFGFAAFCFFVSFSIFSPQLARRYTHARNPILRQTLGHPRRLAGLGPFFCTRLPIIYECVTHSRWKLGTVFSVWAQGDFTFSF